MMVSYVMCGTIYAADDSDASGQQVLNCFWRGKYATTVNTNETNNSTACRFCALANAPKENDEENLVIARDEHTTTMMNLNPYTPGHILIIPNTCGGTICDLSDQTRAALLPAAAQLLCVLKTKHKYSGYTLGINEGKVAGASIPGHFHVHIVPKENEPDGWLCDVKELGNELRKLLSTHQPLPIPWHARVQNVSKCENCTMISDAKENEKVIKRWAFCTALVKIPPITTGHVLIIPIEHCNTISALSSGSHTALMYGASQVTAVLKQLLGSEGFNIGINEKATTGGHIYMQVIPRDTGDRSFMSTIANTTVVDHDPLEIAGKLRSLLEKVD